MSDSPDLTMDMEKRPPRPPRPKALQFALIMLGACIFLSLAIGILFREVPATRPGVAPARADTAVPARGDDRIVNLLQYQADASGHFFVDAVVNGTTIRFLVDTGASVIALSPDDARAAGISDGVLSFSETVNTANGPTQAAQTTLHSLRLQQFELFEMPAIVMERSMPVSLLGMSFLRRLRGYNIRDGVLTMEW